MKKWSFLLLLLVSCVGRDAFAQEDGSIASNRSDSLVSQISIWGEDIIGCVGEKKLVLSVVILNDTSVLRLNHLGGKEEQVRKVIPRNISQELTLFEQGIANAQCDDSVHFLRFSRTDFWRMYPVCENQWRLILDFIEGLE